MSAPGNKQRTSTKDDWTTPQNLFDLIDKRFHFDVDVCADASNAKVDWYYGPDSLVAIDGLEYEWARDKQPQNGHAVWMNPPYSDVTNWVVKAIQEWAQGITVAALLPNNTDNQSWYHNLVVPTASEIWLLKGRVQFLDENGEIPKRWNEKTQKWETSGNTTGSMLVIWRAHEPVPGLVRYLNWDWKKELAA